MHPDITNRLTRAFETLQHALTPYVQNAMEAVYGAEWQRQAQEGLHDPYLPQKTWDVQALLLIMSNNWHTVFGKNLGETERNLIGELRAMRSPEPASAPSPSDAFRTLDTVARLLRAVGDEVGAQAVQQDALAMMQRQFQPPAATPPPLPADTPDPEPPAETPQPPPAEQADDTSEDPAPPDEEATPEASEDAEREDAEDDAEPDDEDDDRESAVAGVKSWLGRLFHKADEQDLEPLELRTRLLDKIEGALRRFRSERPLPFNQITVHILAPTSGDRFTYDAALNDLDPPFEQAVLNRLTESGFDLPAVFAIKPQLHNRAPKKLEAAFEETGPIVVDLRKHATRTSATITVVKGKAGKSSYRVRSTSDAHINLGRLRQVEDDHYGHVVRRNDIAFLDHTDPSLSDDEQAINETVSRRHAHIEYDPKMGAFVLFNDQGVTSISRAGLPRPVRVSHQPAPLQDGDMIYLGRASLRFETKRRG